MSANLITGNLFKPIYAYQDADYQAGISGNVTSIMPVGSQMALSIEDANTIKADDGVLITKEGRRIQIDAGAIEEWSIPTGTQGQTNYYIVGFRLYTGDNSAELCETFVEKMENATDTIPEDTFRSGATEVHISLGRVVQNGINLESVASFLPIAQSFENVKNAILSLNNGLNGKVNKSTINEYTSTPSNLAQFVQGTAIGNIMVSFRFNDANNVLGLGASQWVKGYIQYQNVYGGSYDVNGIGIVSIQGGNPIFIKVTGTGTSFAVTRRDLADGTTYNAGSCPDNTTFATNGSVKREHDALKSIIKMSTFTSHVTMQPNTQTNVTFNIAKNGYTPIAIKLIVENGNWIRATCLKWEGNDVRYSAQSGYGAAITNNRFTLKVTYINSGYVGTI